MAPVRPVAGGPEEVVGVRPRSAGGRVEEVDEVGRVRRVDVVLLAGGALRRDAVVVLVPET